MEENLTVDNPAAQVVDNPSAEPTSGVNGTDTTNGQAQGGAPDEIFKGVDPNRLPPEVKSHYDSMLRDYREKTAKLSETIKAEVAKNTEAYKSKAEYYDQFATQKEFVDKWNEYVKEQQTLSQSGGQPAEGDPVLNQMKAQLQELNQKIQLSEMSQITEAFIDAVDEKGQKLHPEFDSLNNIVLGSMQNGPQAEEFSLLRACIELSNGKTPQEKLANGYKSAKASYDAIFEAGKKAGMGRLQSKIQNGSIPPINSSGEVMTMTDKKTKSAREALDMAKRGIMVSRE